ncbi:MAG: hypothetical protein Q9219_000732 [cf. Caloplaca sp. 3 TL-2023]
MASYIEAHKADSDIRAMDQKISLLMTKSKEQAGKNEAMEKKIRALEQRNTELETRLKAAYVSIPSPVIPSPLLTKKKQNSEHNALARHLNALLPSSSTTHRPLHPLHSIHTNAPLKNFPKKEADIRTLSSLEVATLLKELDADVTRVVAAGERKGRLKEVIGVGERGNVVEAVKGEVGVVDGKVDGEGEKGKEKEKGKGEMKLPGKATGPPPGKVLPILKG